jgi:proline iminopeptidase
VRARAATDWSDWEWALTSVDQAARPGPRWSEPAFQLGRARIVTHYFSQDAWLEDGILLLEAGSLAGIRGVMVQGRLDMGAPLATAWELAQAWPDGQLVVVGGARPLVLRPGHERGRGRRHRLAAREGTGSAVEGPRAVRA